MRGIMSNRAMMILARPGAKRNNAEGSDCHNPSCLYSLFKAASGDSDSFPDDETQRCHVSSSISTSNLV